jgi:hypothetical protein
MALQVLQEKESRHVCGVFDAGAFLGAVPAYLLGFGLAAVVLVFFLGTQLFL